VTSCGEGQLGRLLPTSRAWRSRRAPTDGCSPYERDRPRRCPYGRRRAGDGDALRMHDRQRHGRRRQFGRTQGGLRGCGGGAARGWRHRAGARRKARTQGRCAAARAQTRRRARHRRRGADIGQGRERSAVEVREVRAELGDFGVLDVQVTAPSPWPVAPSSQPPGSAAHVVSASARSSGAECAEAHSAPTAHPNGAADTAHRPMTSYDGAVAPDRISFAPRPSRCVCLLIV
jgi:hypothetical protein